MAHRPYFEVHGTAGPFLLLVHGMLSGRAQWLPNLPALAEVCRPVVMELWGHGRSPAPEESDYYGYPNYVAQLEWLRREIGAERWFVCGQSFGATLTIRYALAYPERTEGQIFTNSASALVARTGRGEDADGGPGRDPERMLRTIVEGGRAFIEQMRIHPRHARNLPPAAKEALLADAALVDPRGIAMIFRHLGESSVVDMLPRNRVPALLVCGDLERSFAPGREIAERSMPHLEVVRAEAGHAVNIQQAGQFNAAVIDFMARHRHA